jgi:integrase
MPRYSFQRKEPMTPEEVKGMIEATDSPALKSLMAFLYLYGARIGEALRLQKSDFRILRTSVTVNIQVEKKKQTTAPILWKHPLTVKVRPENDYFVQAILAQLGMVSQGYIWRMSRKTAWRKIHRLNPMCSPHIFRHTRNRRLVDKGADALALMDWNGWSDTRPAANYLGLSGNTALRFSGKID